MGTWPFSTTACSIPSGREILQSRIALAPEDARPVMIRDCPYVTVNHFSQKEREASYLPTIPTTATALPSCSLPLFG